MVNLLNNLQRQHNDLLEISRDLAKSIDAGISFADADLRKDISFVEGKIKIHLTMEDRHLYPLLLGHEEREVQEAAADYKSRMMGLYDSFHAFVVKMKESDGAQDEDLRAELEEILRKLSSRILFEEETLIPLLKRLGIT